MGNHLDTSLYTLKCYAMWPLIALGGGTMEGQTVDGYIYYKNFVNPPEQIAKLRAHEWKENEVLGCSYPKSGTHFLLLTTLLIAFKGDLPGDDTEKEKTCIHSLCLSGEFVPGKKGNNSISMDTPEQCPTNPRICLSHMPMHHVNYNESSCFLYVMRDPVAALASYRRMEYLLFGPVLSPSMDEFLKYHLYTRATGWLDHVLGWWSIRGRPNVSIITYESMIKTPEQAVRTLAGQMKVTLTENQINTVVQKMDKKWALEHIDPYLFQAKTPFSPPDRDHQTHSAFIVDTTKGNLEKFTTDQEVEIRQEYTRKIQKIMEHINSSDVALATAAANAKSFYEHNRDYFSP